MYRTSGFDRVRKCTKKEWAVSSLAEYVPTFLHALRSCETPNASDCQTCAVGRLDATGAHHRTAAIRPRAELTDCSGVSTCRAPGFVDAMRGRRFQRDLPFGASQQGTRDSYEHVCHDVLPTTVYIRPCISRVLPKLCAPHVLLTDLRSGATQQAINQAKR